MACFLRVLATRSAQSSRFLACSSCCRVRHISCFSCLLSSKVALATRDIDDSGNFDLVYRGPITGAVRTVKIFSLSTCVATVFGLPVLLIFSKISLIGKFCLACVIGPVGIGTTFLLHLFVRGYVTTMWYNRTDDKVRVCTLSLLASNVVSEFRLQDVDSVDEVKVLSSFTVKGKGFFIHPELIHDKKLVQKLLRLQPTEVK